MFLTILNSKVLTSNFEDDLTALNHSNFIDVQKAAQLSKDYGLENKQ
jgi:hypothetical protein